MTIELMHGEQLQVLERVILAPTTGVFRPSAPQTVTADGEIVYAGQVVGTIETNGSTTQVTSSFTGFFMGLMAHEGERVRQDQPVAWLRTSAAA
jgi:multidrug efflux pump subunit AcrA (membrane-fusion protein)